MTNMWYVYVLRGEKDKKRYIGSTNNLTRRLGQHTSGAVRATRHRRPLVMIYQEKFEQEIEARHREHYFKTHKGFNELNKILNGA